ncbi:MAG: putative glycoside hydrolase [Capnocytophaga sp.]|nr:putative glycoside hydrolase [Capnocytophaga sp.]
MTRKPINLIRNMKIIQYSIAFIVAFALASCQQNNPKAAAEPNEQKPSFTFSTWITFDGTRDDKSYHDEFRKYKSYGITEVLVNTEADADNLRRLVPIAEAEGITLHAWIMAVNRPGDEEALKHPEWYMVSREGKSCYDTRPYVDYYQWLCPTRKESKAHILKLVSQLAEVEGIASVHLDYIRFPDIYLPIGLLPNYNLVQNEELPQFDFCYCDVCVAEFESIHHKNPRDFTHPAIDIEWKQFRLNKIRNLVNEAAEIVHRKEKMLTAAVFPYPEMSDQMVRQRWDKWKVDRVYPMIYNDFYNEEVDWVGFATCQGVEDLEGKHTELHTGLYVPPLSAGELEEAIRYAWENGATGVSFYDGPAITEAQLDAIKRMAETIQSK